MGRAGGRVRAGRGGWVAQTRFMKETQNTATMALTVLCPVTLCLLCGKGKIMVVYTVQCYTVSSYTCFGVLGYAINAYHPPHFVSDPHTTHNLSLSNG